MHFISWRTVFWIHVPLSILVLYASCRFLSETKGQQGSPRISAGIALAAIGMGTLVTAFTERSAVSGAPLLCIAAVGFALVLIGAGGYVACTEQDFRQNFACLATMWTLLATLCFGATFGAMLVGYDFALVYRFGFSVPTAALLLSPIPLLSVPAARASGALQQGSSYRVLSAGASALLGGSLIFLLLTRARGFQPTLWAGVVALSGAGIGLCFPALTVQLMRGISPDCFALGCGLNQAFRHIGTALGVALLTSGFGRYGSSSLVAVAGLFAGLCIGMLLFLALGFIASNQGLRGARQTMHNELHDLRNTNPVRFEGQGSFDGGAVFKTVNKLQP